MPGGEALDCRNLQGRQTVQAATSRPDSSCPSLPPTESRLRLDGAQAGDARAPDPVELRSALTWHSGWLGLAGVVVVVGVGVSGLSRFHAFTCLGNRCALQGQPEPCRSPESATTPWRCAFCMIFKKRPMRQRGKATLPNAPSSSVSRVGSASNALWWHGRMATGCESRSPSPSPSPPDFLPDERAAPRGPSICGAYCPGPTGRSFTFRTHQADFL